MYPRLILSALLTFSVVSAHASLNEQRTLLRDCGSLAHRCNSSLRATADKEAIDGFTALSKAYRTHRVSLANIDTLSEQQITDISTDFSAALERHAPAVRRGPAVALTSTGQSPLAQLEQAMLEFIAQHEKELLAPTTRKQWLTRLALQTAVETVGNIADYQIKGAIKGFPKKLSKDERAAKKERDAQAAKDFEFPSAHRRLTAATDMNAKEGKLLGGAIAVAWARIAGHLAIDELAPKGISSYTQRITELVAPVMLAGLIMSIGTGSSKPLIDSFMYRALLRFMMTRGMLDRRHALYKPLNMAAYVVPFFNGGSFMAAVNKGKVEVNAITNMLVDGLASMAIYDVLPKSLDKALPRTNALNPAHRRKVCKKTPRDAVWKTFKTIQGIAARTAQA